MNSKQLANVLIKILGVSVFVHGIPSLLQIIAVHVQSNNLAGVWGPALTSYVNSAIGPVSMLIIGAGLVVAGRPLADWLIGGEDAPS